MRALRGRQQFNKPSVVKRKQNMKAVYVEGFRRAEQE
jgi:small subunit ribosomal protein S21